MSVAVFALCLFGIAASYAEEDINGQNITLMPSSASRHGVRFWDIRIDYGQGRNKVISNVDVYNVDEIDK